MTSATIRRRYVCQQCDRILSESYRVTALAHEHEYGHTMVEGWFVWNNAGSGEWEPYTATIRPPSGQWLQRRRELRGFQ